MEGINKKAMCKNIRQTSKVDKNLILVNVAHRESHWLLVGHYL